MTPTALDTRLPRFLAVILGTYPSSSMIFRTFFFVVSEILGWSLITRETVDVATPAFFATSFTVIAIS